MRIFLPEHSKPYQAALPANYNATALTQRFISMKYVPHVSIVIQTGAWATGTAAVTLEQATAVAGTSKKALAFTKMWTDKAAAGTLVETAVVGNTFNLDTADSQWVIEVDAETLDHVLGFDCLALTIATPGANDDYYSAEYVPSAIRYQQATPPSVHLD